MTWSRRVLLPSWWSCVTWDKNAPVMSKCSWLVSSLSDHARSSARLIFVWKANILRENLQLRDNLGQWQTYHQHSGAKYERWWHFVTVGDHLQKLAQLRALSSSVRRGVRNITHNTWHVTIRDTSQVTMSRPSSLTRLGSLLSPNSPRSFRKHVKLDFPDLNGEQLVKNVKISFSVMCSVTAPLFTQKKVENTGTKLSVT